MPQACLLTQETVLVCAIKMDMPTADVQAMLEDYDSIQETFYIVFDWTNRNGYYHPWCSMRDDKFAEELRFVHEPPSNKKFEPVVTI